MHKNSPLTTIRSSRNKIRITNLSTNIRLSKSQLDIMFYLGNYKEKNISNFIKLLKIDRVNVWRHLEALQEKGFIKKKKEGRVVVVSLTESGRSIWDFLDKLNTAIGKSRVKNKNKKNTKS